MKAAKPAGCPSRDGREARKYASSFSLAQAVAAACIAASTLAACGGGNVSDASSPEAIAAAEAATKAVLGRDEGGVDIGGGTTGTASGAAAAAASQVPADPAAAAQPGAAAGTGSASSASPETSQPAAPVTINSLDTIVDDMRLLNDRELAGIPSHYGWSRGPGQVVMGADSRGSHTPSWWVVYDTSYKSDAYWNAILPWLVVFDGTGNAARNTRVQVRDMKTWMKSRASGQWVLLEHARGVNGEHYPKSLQGANVSGPDTRTEADGSTSILPPGGSLVFHGWSNGFSTVDGSDIAAIFITLQARLVKDQPEGSDDRASAEYLIHVGGDYYPSTSTRVGDLAPAYYFPGIGVSRAKLVTSEWQAFSFATIDAAVQDPGGGVISEAAFRAAPPPLD